MVCMNFLAMPTLKNVRSCCLRPISIMPLRSLNDTFESARIGIANAGSFARWAAAMTRSAMPTSLVSTPPAAFRFFALGAGCVLVSTPLAVFLAAFVLAMGSSGLPCGRLLRARRAGPARLLGSLLGLRGRRFHLSGRFDLALDPLRGHDDRVGQTLGAAAGLAQQLIGLRAAGAGRRDLLELLLELPDRELAALQTVAGLRDLLDVELEDVAPSELALRPPATPEEHAEPAAALTQRERDLLADLVVVGNRLLGLARERHPHGRHVHEDHHRSLRQRAARLADTVVLPLGVERRLVGRASGLLVEERHPVRVADHAGQLGLALVALALGERLGFLLRLRPGFPFKLLVLDRPVAECEPGLDHEGIAAIDRGGAAHGGVELALDLVIEAREDGFLADRRETIGGRRHDLGGLERAVDRLRRLSRDVAGPRARGDAGALADLLRELGRYAAEIGGEETGERMARGVMQHLEQHAELDAIGVGLDLAGRLGQLFDRALEPPALALDGVIRERHMRVRYRDLLEVLVHRGAAFLVLALHLERDLGAARPVPVDLLVLVYQRLVLLGVDLDFEVMGWAPGARARDDLHRLAGRELAVHAGGRDPDALLAAALAQAMELGAVEQLREHPRDLLAHDARAVVRDRDPETRRLARRRRRSVLRDDLELHLDVGEDPAFLARIERVVHRLLHAGEQCLARAVETQQVAVLGEELGDRDLALARPHLLGRDTAPGPCAGLARHLGGRSPAGGPRRGAGFGLPPHDHPGRGTPPCGDGRRLGRGARCGQGRCGSRECRSQRRASGYRRGADRFAPHALWAACRLPVSTTLIHGLRHLSHPDRNRLSRPPDSTALAPLGACLHD